ncbi:MAG: GNAT family N-acetyltransferase [Lewinellaceae bacterium]|nr:GNAT family N-acetyltransferase [Lewinellaceae bacterium]
MDLEFKRYAGPEIKAVFESLAHLRMVVFREFPYLYAGSIEYEREYLRTYAASGRALLFAVFDGANMVGATTCIPLTDETNDVQAPFRKAGVDVSEVFYFGESILLPEYRGLGLGHRFFDVRETHAASFGTFRRTCFCAVERPDDHPARPVGYQPLHAFWEKRGYRKAPTLRTKFSWPDIGETISTPKNMTFWIRNTTP